MVDQLVAEKRKLELSNLELRAQVSRQERELERNTADMKRHKDLLSLCLAKLHKAREHILHEPSGHNNKRQDPDDPDDDHDHTMRSESSSESSPRRSVESLPPSRSSPAAQFDQDPDDASLVTPEQGPSVPHPVADKDVASARPDDEADADDDDDDEDVDEEL